MTNKISVWHKIKMFKIIVISMPGILFEKNSLSLNHALKFRFQFSNDRKRLIIYTKVTILEGMQEQQQQRLQQSGVLREIGRNPNCIFEGNVRVCWCELSN